MTRDKQKKRILELETDFEKTIYLIHLYLDRYKEIEYCCEVFQLPIDFLKDYFKSIDILDRQDELKMCTKCFEIKPKTSEYFYEKLDNVEGLNTNCIACKNKYCKGYYDVNAEVINAQSRLYHQEHWDTILPVKQAYNELHKEERKVKQHDYYEANKEELLAYGKEHRKTYDPLHKDERNEYHRNRRFTHPEKYRARRAKRRCAEANAIPPWVDYNEIEKVYYNAKVLEKQDGIKRHVDHIDPIQSDLICGLHVSGNLQILTDAENCSKGNKFKPYIIDSDGNITFIED